MVRRAQPLRRRKASLTCERRQRTAQKGEALRQERRDFVRMDSNECACGNGVTTPDRPARKYRDGRPEQARGKPAATAIGDGSAVTAKTPRMTSIPSDQRATDSHYYTRLGNVDIWVIPVAKARTANFLSAGTRSSPDALHSASHVAAPHCGGENAITFDL